MKKIKIILMLTFIFITVLTAQNNNAVKAKNIDGNKNSIVANNYESNPKAINTVSERVFTTVIVISELALLLGILYYWRKTRSDNKVNSKSIFKKNIQALRHERIKYFDNEKLSAKRKQLQTKINSNNIDGKFITTKAKHFSVSKGEIFLAARIKQLQAKT